MHKSLPDHHKRRTRPNTNMNHRRELRMDRSCTQLRPCNPPCTCSHRRRIRRIHQAEHHRSCSRQRECQDRRTHHIRQSRSHRNRRRLAGCRCNHIHKSRPDHHKRRTRPKTNMSHRRELRMDRSCTQLRPCSHLGTRKIHRRIRLKHHNWMLSGRCTHMHCWHHHHPHQTYLPRRRKR